MNQAAKAVLFQKITIAEAAKKYLVPRTTLRRHIKYGGCSKKQLGRKAALTEQQETELTNLILNMKRNLFGLTIKDVRRLVFEYCFMKSIKNPFNSDDKMAGRVWIQSYMKRHKDIELPRTLEKNGKIDEEICNFFTVLQKMIYQDGQKVVPDDNIYNIHEFGFSIGKKNPRVVSHNHLRVLKTEEKKQMVGFLSCISAVGHYIPPMMIFPREGMELNLMVEAVPGAIGSTHKIGEEDEKYLLDWFDHFLAHVQSKHRKEKTILILDGKNFGSLSLELLHRAEENNVSLLSLPSNCSMQLQPLIKTFFKSINVNYDREVQIWSHIHPDGTFDDLRAVALFRNAYCKSATVETAVNGFLKCGIMPFNPNVIKHRFT